MTECERPFDRVSSILEGAFPGGQASVANIDREVHVTPAARAGDAYARAARRRWPQPENRVASDRQPDSAARLRPPLHFWKLQQVAVEIDGMVKRGNLENKLEQAIRLP